jgi:hypothetical protein
MMILRKNFLRKISTTNEVARKMDTFSIFTGLIPFFAKILRGFRFHPTVPVPVLTGTGNYYTARRIKKGVNVAN